ncbi:MAG: SDR family oxidoreductase [Bacteroidota bacterium]|jgi:NAD(P)-dependent dehydrogenase (short-subunit alcohol dehydrogenase family)|nr:MAG: short-chain dehydrogenase [Bacteroidota bacterium]
MKYTEGMLQPGAMKDKTIIITGGGTGLGRSIGKYILQLGGNIVIASRKEDVLNKTASELTRETGGQILAVGCDVRHYEEIENVIRQTEERFGAVHGVLNNAAGNFISPTERLSHRAFDAVVDIVLKGTYYFSLAAGKNWIAKKQPGVFLNIVTTYAWTGSGYVVPSACGKAGVLALTRSLAVEWARYNIRTNAIAPGPFPTQGAWSRLLPGELAEKFNPANRIPLKRVGHHQEIANLAAYLLSDYSAFVNGEVITIDGGEWLRNGGEFSHLETIPSEMWDRLEKMRSQQTAKG